MVADVLKVITEASFMIKPIRSLSVLSNKLSSEMVRDLQSLWSAILFSGDPGMENSML